MYSIYIKTKDNPEWLNYVDDREEASIDILISTLKKLSIITGIRKTYWIENENINCVRNSDGIWHIFNEKPTEESLKRGEEANERRVNEVMNEANKLG